MSGCRYATGYNKHETISLICTAHDDQEIFDPTMIDVKILRILWAESSYSLKHTPIYDHILPHVKHALGEWRD